MRSFAAGKDWAEWHEDRFKAGETQEAGAEKAQDEEGATKAEKVAESKVKKSCQL